VSDCSDKAKEAARLARVALIVAAAGLALALLGLFLPVSAGG
jgi:hypothetical protein